MPPAINPIITGNGNNPSPSPGTRLYAIGDIHGRHDLLVRLLDRIEADAEQAGSTSNRLIYLGDYVDRGPHSAQVIDHITRYSPAGFERVALLGNHEQAVLDFLVKGTPSWDWLKYGGGATLLSYGVIPPRDPGNPRHVAEARDALRAAMPAHHLEFLTNLVPFWRDGDFFLAHAGIMPGIDLDQQSVHDLIWVREPFLSSMADHGACIVHGHTISETITYRHNRIGLDTGAFHTGILSALVADGGEISFLQASL